MLPNLSEIYRAVGAYFPVFDHFTLYVINNRTFHCKTNYNWFVITCTYLFLFRKIQKPVNSSINKNNKTSLTKIMRHNMPFPNFNDVLKTQVTVLKVTVQPNWFGKKLQYLYTTTFGANSSNGKMMTHSVLYLMQ